MEGSLSEEEWWGGVGLRVEGGVGRGGTGVNGKKGPDKRGPAKKG